MGHICAKTNNPDYSHQYEENIKSPFHQLDNIKLTEYQERQLKFYRDLDDKFCVLNSILLSDFMSLLNNFTKSHTEERVKHRDIKTETITKNEWLQFCENKILKNPIAKKFSENLKNNQTQFFDDIADDIRFFYAMYNELENNEELSIPKIAFFSVGFNYCYPKMSQKILILLSLFTDNNNKISLNNDMMLFFFLIFSNVFRTPIRFLAKELGITVDKSSIFHNINLNEAEKIININEPIIREIIIKLANNLSDSLFDKDGSKEYTKEEFKKTILDDEYIWIFSNKGIKMKIEEELTNKNIGVSNII